MPKLPGLFDSFDNLDQIPLEAIAVWLKPLPNIIQLENYLANRILYPQSLPLTEYDMKIDLSILREALKLNVPREIEKKASTLLGDNPFINITLRKITIPKSFIPFTPNLTSLTWAFIDGLLLNRRKEDWFQDLWTVVLTDDFDEIVGSILLPQFEDQRGLMELNLLNKDYKATENFKIHAGSLMVIPCPQDKCQVSYKSSKGTILGKKENAVEVFGGKLGLIVDSRNI